jgi:hypothetical protein
MLVVANFTDAFRLILPGFRPGGFAFRWTDLCAPVGIGALWWRGWTGHLRQARRMARPSIAAANGLERSHG